MRTASNSSGGYALHQAMRKYGVENFEMELLVCSTDHIHMLREMEPYFVRVYDSGINQNGYNLTEGGESNYGWSPSPETRERMSRSRRNRIISGETREKMRKYMTANPPMHDPTVRDKVSKTMKERGIRPILTAEQQESKRQRQIGKPIHSGERKAALSELFRRENPMHNPVTREKARQNKIGKGTGESNGRAVFAVVTDHDGVEVARGHLASICAERGFPFGKFLANSREAKPLQRGAWKGWDVTRLHA